MTFMVILIALLIERFFDWSHLRHWEWFTNYQRALAKRFQGESPYLRLALAIVPILFVLGIIQILLNGVLYGLLSFLFQLVVLIFCLGPQNLWADTFACINAPDNLKNLFGLTTLNEPQHIHQQFLNSIFIEANRRVFAVIFWYALLGPIGAVLYRLITLLSPEYMPGGRLLDILIDWLPVRVFTFLFALGGHFVKVLSIWRKQLFVVLSGNDILLTECGEAAMGEDLSQVAVDGSAERNAVSLLDRVFIIMVVLVAVAVLVV